MKNLKSKQNLFTIILNMGITFGIVILLSACGGCNDEGNKTQDNVDSVKTIDVQKVDSTAIQDTAKKVDVNVKKP